MPHDRPLLIYVGHDDAIVEQTLLEFLTELGNRAFGFRTGTDFSEMLNAASQKPDVVITCLACLSSQDEDAIELMEQTHRDYPAMAVLLITNGGRRLASSEAASCGLRAYLREPIRLSEVEFYIAGLRYPGLPESGPGGYFRLTQGSHITGEKQ